MTRLTARLLLAATLPTLAACVPAHDGPPRAVTTYYGAKVVPDPDTKGQFRIYGQPGYGPGEFWCAAGEYAQEELGLGPSDRVYLAAPRGRAGEGVLFTVAPSAALAAYERPQGRYGFSLTEPGYNLRAVHARLRCRQIMPLNFEFDAP